MQTRDEVEGLHNYLIFLSYFINKLVYLPVAVAIIPRIGVVSCQFLRRQQLSSSLQVSRCDRGDTNRVALYK